MKPPQRVSLDQAMQFAEAAFDRGERTAAAQICHQILQQKPTYFFALNLLGVIEAQSGRLQAAAEFFLKAGKARPKDVSVHINAGNAFKELGRPQDALAAYDRAVALAPRLADLHNLRGSILRELGRLAEALRSYDRALAVDASLAEAWNNRGNVLRLLGKPDLAIESFDRALALKPKYFDACKNRGLALLDSDRSEDALSGFDAAIALNPGDAEVHNSRAMALTALGREEEALAACDAALDLQAGYADALNNRGIILKLMGRAEEALASYEAAIGAAPNLAEAHNNRGGVLQQLNRADEAIASFDKALELRPDYSNALWNRSFCRLLKGDFAQGWDGFDHRWENHPGAQPRRSFVPEWDGKKLDGSLLVLNEQGIGDEIFYSGMIPDLDGLARRVAVSLDRRLVSIFERSMPEFEFIGEPDLRPDAGFDAQIYMGDLGRYLRRDATSFARTKSPYLFADPLRRDPLRARLAQDGRPVCGVFWSSKGSTVGAFKSLRLADLAPALQVPEIRFVDLQYGDTRAEQDAVRDAFGLELVSVPDVDKFNDMEGLAALLDACDCVVTISNSTAHLALALGKPVFLMLDFSPGLIWYWHVGRKDSPWYPTARLFRQPSPGAWEPVVGEVRDALADFARKFPKADV
jgi:tetratricopeptide (TPR) repeat protein